MRRDSSEKKRLLKYTGTYSAYNISDSVGKSSFWILLTSFRAQKGAYTSSFFPKQYSLDNYVKLLQIQEYLISTNVYQYSDSSSILMYYINIFVLSVAYCMSRLKFKMRKQ